MAERGYPGEVVVVVANLHSLSPPQGVIHSIKILYLSLSLSNPPPIPFPMKAGKRKFLASTSKNAMMTSSNKENVPDYSKKARRSMGGRRANAEAASASGEESDTSEMDFVEEDGFGVRNKKREVSEYVFESHT